MVMDCQECSRLRQALGVATDRWIRADNAKVSVDANNPEVLAEIAREAKVAAARARQALSEHEATHRKYID
jgi:hypothetical protein